MQLSIPSSVDVAVIGGGIIGISTAWALAKAGKKVAVFEKGRIAGEQSSRNWGWIRTVGRDPAELPLALYANTLWQQIQSQVDVGYRQTGLMYLAENDADIRSLQSWCDRSRQYPTGVELLNAEQTAHRLNTPSNRKWTGAAYSAIDGVAEPDLATTAIAGLARALGVQIYENTAVRALQQSSGKLQGIITEAGVVQAESVVLAGGAWSRLFCGNMGVNFPQLKVHASVLRTSPLDTGVDLAINGKDFTLRKRADGGYSVSQLGASVADVTPDSILLCGKFFKAWMAEKKYLKLRFGKRFFEELMLPRRFPADRPTPFEKVRTWDPPAVVGSVEQALGKLKQAFPAFETAQVAQSWAGMIDVTPDAIPAISKVDAIPGFYLASGFSGHGFGIGPAAGQLMADIVLERPSFVSPDAFRLSRF